jgi:hypothetical protein
MALYNNGFPATYQPLYPQFLNPYQPAQYQQSVQPQQQQPQAQQQGMTPPIVHADIVQVSSEAEAANYPVAAGASQMMILKDDSQIFVKEAFSNGQTNLSVYVKRPPEPPEKPVDLTAYVTWDKLEERLASLSQPVKRATKKETEGE